MKRSTAFLLVLALVVTFCPGCTKKFSRQRYETLYVGMPDFQVRKVLGKPKSRSGNVWTYVNETPYYKAVIHFESGKVADTSWSNDRWADRDQP